MGKTFTDMLERHVAVGGSGGGVTITAAATATSTHAKIDMQLPGVAQEACRVLVNMWAEGQVPEVRQAAGRTRTRPHNCSCPHK
jgi:hypothetical protein